MNPRTLVLRQSGLIDLAASARAASVAGVPIALVDGAVETTHSAFRGCHISRVGDSQSAQASDHATFNASVLVGDEAGRVSGQTMALCPNTELVNFPVITDAILEGRLPVRTIATIFATAIHMAIEKNCRTVLLGVAIVRPESTEWQPLRECIRYATNQGTTVVIPAGNRPTVPLASGCGWPDVLVVGSCSWQARASIFSPLFGRSANSVFAPGEDIPGAGPNSTLVLRSGTSFAAAIAAGAICLAQSLLNDCASNRGIAAQLFPAPHRVLDGTSFRKHIA